MHIYALHIERQDALQIEKSADPGRWQGGARQGREVVDNKKYNNGSWEAFQSSRTATAARSNSSKYKIKNTFLLSMRMYLCYLYVCTYLACCYCLLVLCYYIIGLYCSDDD